jgi:microcystin-dependent protein
MALESATYISDLVSTNPTSSDGIAQGDDHLRLLKSTIKATFPNVSGAVTATHTELNYVDGVTSAIQGQIDAKAPLASPTFTGTVVLPSTTSVGNVTATELGYLDGVTSSIQTQIDAKASTASLGTAASLNVGTSANNIVQLDGSAKLPAVDGSALTNLPVSFSMPSGCVMPYAGSSAPSGWLFAFGQNVSRTTYAALFAAIGTAYGSGDGSTTFALPDLRGRVVAGKDDMGGTSANRLTNQTGGLDGDVLGATGGAETHTLTIAQMPAHTHTVSGVFDTTSGTNNVGSGSNDGFVSATTSSAGSGAAHNNVQPTLVLNYIIKT